MEALVAVGFAANILNFVDFICHALKIGNQIRRNGMSDSNADLEKSITLLEHQMNKIRMQCGQTTSDTDVDECLGKLAAECITIAQEIKGFIEKFELDKTKSATLKKVPEKLQPSPNELKYEQLIRRKRMADEWTSYLKKAPVPLTADQENEKSKLEARRAQLKQIKECDKECRRRKIEILEPFTDKHEGELYAVEQRYGELLSQKSKDDAWKEKLGTKVAPLPFTDDHKTELKNLRTIVDHEKSKFESQRIAIQEANNVIKKSKSERLKIKTLAKAVELEWNKPKIKELVEKLERIRSILQSEVMLGIQRSVRDLQTRSESTNRLLEQIAASGSEHRARASAERKHGQSVTETLMKSQQSHLLQFDIDAKQRHETLIQAIDSFKTCLESRVLFPTLPVLLTRRDPSLQSAAFYGYEAIENAVLGTLHYRRMEAREAQVHDAHEKTCRWIFEDPKDADRPWTNFRQWLEQGKGCYWIEGKAGCGKSTLMKFLRSDVRTQRALEKWSESKQCIVASCFFWMAGTSLQKNQEGLLRSLLHTILSQRRELISRVLPGLYNALMPQIFQDNSNPDIFFSCDNPGCSHSFRQPSQLEEHQNTEHAEGATVDVAEPSGALTVAELRKAFNLLASQHLNDFQICLLVDGLDEYAGNQQDVAELFKTVTKHPFIKAVVSSRPEATFVEAFSKTPKLRMEDLTAPDFELYIKNTLLCHSQMQAQARTTGLAERLTSKILTRACGVFLWVALVVRSLIQCLSDGSYPEELETAIEAYPPELHELYEHMFARMKPSHRLDAFKLFQAVSIAQEVESEIPTALQLSYFERDNSIGAIRMPIQGISPAQLEERLSTMQARLRSRCCGLLEVHSDTSSYTGSQIPRSAEGRVVFLHRTVSDFLQDPGVRDLLDRETLSIRREIYENLLASFLYRFKSRDFYRVKNLAQWKQLTKDIEAFMIYCERSGPRNQEYLEEYKKVLTELYNKVLTEPRATNGQRSMAASWMELVLQERGLKVSPESDDNPLLSLLVRFGLLSPARKIISSMDSSKTLFFETGGRLIVLRLCFWAMQHGDLSSAHIEIMQCFIDSGFDVNARAVKQAGGMQRTAWESLLRLAPHVLPTQTSDLVAHCYARSSVVEPGSEVSHGNMASRLHSWIGLVALFIRSGADLGLELEPCSSVPKGGTAREVIREILTTAIDGAALSSAELVKLEEEKARVEGLLDERPNIIGACRANILPSNAPLLRVSSTQAKERTMSRARKVEDCTKLSQHETRNGPDSQTMVPAFATTDPQTRQNAVEALEEAGFTGSQIDSAIERAGVGYDVVGLVAWILDHQNQAHQAAKAPRNLSPFGNNATRAQIHGADAKSRQWAVVAKELSKPQQPKVVVGAHYILKPKKPKNRRPKKSTIDSVKYDDPTENAHASRSQPGTAAGSFCLPSGTFTWFFETNNGHRSDVTFSSEQLSQLQKLVESMIQE